MTAGRAKLRVLHAGLEWGYWGRLAPDCLDNPKRGQIAGGETAMLRAAEAMAASGHEVVVASDVMPGAYKGVRYVVGQESFFDEALDNGPWDAIVIWGDPDEFGNLTAAGACETTVRICAQQVNDFLRPDASLGFTDIYVFPSWDHAKRMTKAYGIPCERLRAIPNAVHPPRFHWDSPREPDAVYIASSPDRGRHLLYALWPTIKAACPLATLDVYYETARWLASCRNDLAHPAIRLRARQFVRAEDATFYGLDVRIHGAVNQQVVIDCACTAGVMAYPCYPLAYTEGFCTAGIEAYCAGAIPVMTTADALPEVYGDKAVLVDKDRIDKDFAGKVIEAIETQRERKAKGWLGWHFPDEATARTVCARYSWAAVGAMWVRLIETETAARSAECVRAAT